MHNIEHRPCVKKQTHLSQANHQYITPASTLSLSRYEVVILLSRANGQKYLQP